MKTDDLIRTLASDETTEPHMTRTLFAAVGAAVVLAGLVWLAMLGPRPDFMPALHTVRFVFKFVFALVLAGTAALVALPMSQPFDQPSKWRPLLLLAPALLVGAVIAELAMVPSSEWMKIWMGHNARVCLMSIPAIAAAPLAIILLAMRAAAPARPVRAGAIAGLLAGGLAAFFYAAHCFDDSPLFVSTWYTLGIGFVTGVGALLGGRLLRW